KDGGRNVKMPVIKPAASREADTITVNPERRQEPIGSLQDILKGLAKKAKGSCSFCFVLLKQMILIPFSIAESKALSDSSKHQGDAQKASTSNGLSSGTTSTTLPMGPRLSSRYSSSSRKYLSNVKRPTVKTLCGIPD